MDACTSTTGSSCGTVDSATRVGPDPCEYSPCTISAQVHETTSITGSPPSAPLVKRKAPSGRHLSRRGKGETSMSGAQGSMGSASLGNHAPGTDPRLRGNLALKKRGNSVTPNSGEQRGTGNGPDLHALLKAQYIFCLATAARGATSSLLGMKKSLCARSPACKMKGPVPSIFSGKGSSSSGLHRKGSSRGLLLEAADEAEHRRLTIHIPPAKGLLKKGMSGDIGGSDHFDSKFLKNTPAGPDYSMPVWARPDYEGTSYPNRYFSQWKTPELLALSSHLRCTPS